MFSLFHHVTRATDAKNRAAKAVATFVFILILIALGAGASNYYTGEKIRSLERQADSLRVEADGLRAERDSLLSVVRGLEGDMSAQQQKNVLWTTRAVLSETKRPSEMLYVANVIRNRLDARYRGAETVKEVVLDRYQFSGFNPNRQSRWHYMNLSRDQTHGYLWDVAWEVSEYVLTMPRSALPFRDVCVNHFFYPNVRSQSPPWPLRMEQVELGDVQLSRVNFYRQNSNQCDG